MKIIYRNQLPGKPPRTTVISGWVGALIGILVGIGVLILLALIIPLVFAFVIGFIGFIIIMMIVGWIYFAIKIGWRDMWDFTRAVWEILFGRGSEPKFERLSKAWENRTKGRPGEWVK
jgi:hypothetical protein